MAVLLLLIVLPFVFAAPLLMIWALVDMLRRPSAQWEAADQPLVVWAIIVVFAPFIGPMLYMFIGRKQLERVPAPPAPSYAS